MQRTCGPPTAFSPRGVVFYFKAVFFPSFQGEKRGRGHFVRTPRKQKRFLMFTLNSFTIYLALTPLALYFMLVGLMNMTGRPFLVTGVRDMTVLFLALFGLAAVGPMQLFFPVNASWSYGIGVWIFLTVIYVLLCTLFLILQRPSLNLYNVTMAEFRPVFFNMVVELDPAARWAGDSVFLPTLGIQLFMDSNPLLRSISLVSAGPNQNYGGWKTLQERLMENLRTQGKTFTPKYTVGIAFFLAGLLLLTGMHVLILFDSASFLKAIPDFLRI